MPNQPEQPEQPGPPEQPEQPPRHERATPPSAFVQAVPEKVYLLVARCDELARDLRETEIPAWIIFFSWWGEWYERMRSHIYDKNRDIPQDIKPTLIKRLQILEAELKVAFSLVTSVRPPPPRVPRVIRKDLANVEATFRPGYRYDIPSDPKKKMMVDHEPERRIYNLP